MKTGHRWNLVACIRRTISTNLGILGYLIFLQVEQKLGCVIFPIQKLDCIEAPNNDNNNTCNYSMTKATNISGSGELFSLYWSHKAQQNGIFQWTAVNSESGRCNHFFFCNVLRYIQVWLQPLYSLRMSMLSYKQSHSCRTGFAFAHTNTHTHTEAGAKVTCLRNIRFLAVR